MSRFYFEFCDVFYMSFSNTTHMATLYRFALLVFLLPPLFDLPEQCQAKVHSFCWQYP